MSQNIINIPIDTFLPYRCVTWDIRTDNAYRHWRKEKYKIYGEATYGDEEYYCIEEPDYPGENYYMVRKQDLLPFREYAYEIY